MAESGVSLPDIVKRTMEANTRLYRGWLELSLEYFRGITEILDPDAKYAEEESEVELEPELGALVLEAEGGRVAKGAFLVTNDLGRELTCTLTTSTFSGVDDKTVRPKVSFEPKSVRLAPGEQQVVQASITMGTSWDPGAAYTGEFSIKGMEGFQVPVVLRRLHEVDDSSHAQASPIDQVSVSVAKPRKKKVAKKKATKKKAAKKAPARARKGSRAKK